MEEGGERGPRRHGLGALGITGVAGGGRGIRGRGRYEGALAGCLSW